jgi:hypothetical protein
VRRSNPQKTRATFEIIAWHFLVSLGDAEICHPPVKVIYASPAALRSSALNFPYIHETKVLRPPRLKALIQFLPGVNMRKGLAREKARGVANKRSELVTQTLSFNIDSATCNCLQTNICWGGHNWIFSSPQANKVVPSFFNFYSALQSIKPRTQSLPQFAKGRGCQIGSLIATQYKSLSPVRTPCKKQ